MSEEKLNIFEQALILNSENPYINNIRHKKANFYNLNVEFLKQKKYGVKNVFDAIDKYDIDYFIEVLNCKSEYCLFSSINNNNIKTIKYSSKKEIENNFFNMFPEMTILEFSGSEIYIYMQDTIYYQIFGKKENLKLIKRHSYSEEKAKNDLDHLNKVETSYFQWLYDTYQHL